MMNYTQHTERSINTETAIFKVVSDIHSCIDQDQGVIIMLLDLSVIFDTVDYDLYVVPLSNIAQQHDISIHSYADDTHLYISFDYRDLSSISKGVKCLECGIDDIRIWILRNRLKMKMNNGKTEMLIFDSPRAKRRPLSIAVGAKSHQPAGHLGMTMYVHPTMEAYIKQVCQVLYFQLKTILTVQNVLSPKPCVRLKLSARLCNCSP